MGNPQPFSSVWVKVWVKGLGKGLGGVWWYVCVRKRLGKGSGFADRELASLAHSQTVYHTRLPHAFTKRLAMEREVW